MGLSRNWPCQKFSHSIAASSGNSEFYFNAKAQRCQDAKQADLFFATLRLGVFALNPSASERTGALHDASRGLQVAGKRLASWTARSPPPLSPAAHSITV